MDEKTFLMKMQDILDTENLTTGTMLTDIEEWDSVSMLGYAAIALDLGKKLTAEQIRACLSLGDLYALLK